LRKSLVASLLLGTAAPALAQYNYYNVNNKQYRKAVKQQQNRYGGGVAAARAFNQQRAANYVIQQQQAAAIEAQRQQLQNSGGLYNNFYNPYGQSFYPNNFNNNSGYFYGQNRSGLGGILNSIF